MKINLMDKIDLMDAISQGLLLGSVITLILVGADVYDIHLLYLSLAFSYLSYLLKP